jgi:hypothetical protein
MTLTTTSDEVLEFMKDAQEMIDMFSQKMNYNNSHKLFIVEGKTFLKIVSKNTFNGVVSESGSAWGFIAKDDGNNKGMGSWKRGDLFKSASWAVPAKHARGNVIEKKWQITTYGPAYLK